MQILRFSFDPDADAAYARLCEGKIDSSSEIAPGLIVDWSDDDRPLGLEVLADRDRIGQSDPESFVAGLVEGLFATRLDHAEPQSSLSLSIADRPVIHASPTRGSARDLSSSCRPS